MRMLPLVRVRESIGLLEGTESDASKNRAVVIAESAAATRATPVSVGDNKRTTELLEVAEPGRSTELAVVTASAEACLVFPADHAATAGESQRIIGLRERCESDFPSLNSSLGSLSSACARRVALFAAPASARVCPGFSSLAVSAVVARTHASFLHGAGFQGEEESFSDPAEDLRPCLRGGGRGKFLAGRRCTGAGRRFTSQATRFRYHKTQGRCGRTFPPSGGFLVDVDWTKMRGIWVTSTSGTRHSPMVTWERLLCSTLFSTCP